MAEIHAVATSLPDWRRGIQRTDAAGTPLYITAAGTATTDAAQGVRRAILVTNELLYDDANGNPTLDPTGNAQRIVTDNANASGRAVRLYTDASGRRTTSLASPSVVIDNANRSGYAVPLYYDHLGRKSEIVSPNKLMAQTESNTAPLIYYDTQGLDTEAKNRPAVPTVATDGTAATIGSWNDGT